MMPPTKRIDPDASTRLFGIKYAGFSTIRVVKLTVLIGETTGDRVIDGESFARRAM